MKDHVPKHTSADDAIRGSTVGIPPTPPRSPHWCLTSRLRPVIRSRPLPATMTVFQPFCKQRHDTPRRAALPAPIPAGRAADDLDGVPRAHPTGLFNLIMHFLGDEKRTSPLLTEFGHNVLTGIPYQGVYYLRLSSTWIPMSRCCCYLSRLSRLIKHTKADMTQMKLPRGLCPNLLTSRKCHRRKRHMYHRPDMPQKHHHENAMVLSMPHAASQPLTSDPHTTTLRTPLGWR